MKTANTISLTRMGWLLRYNWELNKLPYLAFILSLFLIISILFSAILFSNVGILQTLKEPFRTQSVIGYAYSLFLFGYFAVSLLWLGQSFLALRNPQKAKSYLLLPASTTEKYIIELVIRFVGLFVVYPFVFWIATNMSLVLFQRFGNIFLEDIKLEYVGVTTLKKFWMKKDFAEQMTFIKVTLVGLFALIPSLMWSGSLIFGKYNFFWMPLSTIVTYLVLSATTLGISWIMHPGILRVNGQVKLEMLNFEEPEILPEIPLLIVMIAIWIWIAIILSYVVAYFKLKEKQV